jgi:transcriptional regulator with XRE-family HTH domain
MSQAETNKNNPQKKIGPFLQYVGEELFTLRKSHKKSIKTVAKDTKMSPGIISKVEKGLYENLGVTRFLQLCKYYKVHVHDVIDRIEQRERTDTI